MESPVTSSQLNGFQISNAMDFMAQAYVDDLYITLHDGHEYIQIIIMDAFDLYGLVARLQPFLNPNSYPCVDIIFLGHTLVQLRSYLG